MGSASGIRCTPGATGWAPGSYHSAACSTTGAVTARPPILESRSISGTYFIGATGPAAGVPAVGRARRPGRLWESRSAVRGVAVGRAPRLLRRLPRLPRRLLRPVARLLGALRLPRRRVPRRGGPLQLVPQPPHLGGR